MPLLVEIQPPCPQSYLISCLIVAPPGGSEGTYEIEILPCIVNRLEPFVQDLACICGV